AVMTNVAGQASQLRCPYHGWTYSLEGHLRSAPDLGSVCNFDRESMGLRPVDVAVWKQWVMIRIDPKGSEIVDISGFDPASYKWFERRCYIVSCNWKVFVDNYLDGGYHVPHLHKGLDAELDYSEYRIELGDRYCLQSSPYKSATRALYYWIY